MHILFVFWQGKRQKMSRKTSQFSFCIGKYQIFEHKIPSIARYQVFFVTHTIVMETFIRCYCYLIVPLNHGTSSHLVEKLILFRLELPLVEAVV